MTTVTLCFYEIVMYPPRRKDDRLKLDQLAGSEKDLLVFLHNFFSGVPQKLKAKANADDKGAFALKSIDALDSKRSFSGIMRSGEQGVGSELVNHADGSTAFKRKREHIEAIPLYFLVDLPQGAKSALLAFQTFGMRSMSGKVSEKLLAALNTAYGDEYTVKLRSIQIGDIYKNDIKVNGVVQDIVATKYVRSRDIASDAKKNIKCTISFSPAKKGGFGVAVKDLLTSGTMKDVRENVSTLLAIDLPAGLAELQASVKINGRVRLVNLRSQESMATRFDITGDISFDPVDGHPVISSIDKVAREILKNQIRHIVS